MLYKCMYVVNVCMSLGAIVLILTYKDDGVQQVAP